jgi:hypothetical protein
VTTLLGAAIVAKGSGTLKLVRVVDYETLVVSSNNEWKSLHDVCKYVAQETGVYAVDCTECTL